MTPGRRHAGNGGARSRASTEVLSRIRNVSRFNRIFCRQNILDALRKATEKRTSIVIAHRLMTVMDADDILVLDQGNLVERGTHSSLLSTPNSLYSKLWDTQHLTTKKFSQAQEQRTMGEQCN